MSQLNSEFDWTELNLMITKICSNLWKIHFQMGRGLSMSFKGTTNPQIRIQSLMRNSRTSFIQHRLSKFCTWHSSAAKVNGPVYAKMAMARMMFVSYRPFSPLLPIYRETMQNKQHAEIRSESLEQSQNSQQTLMFYES